MRLAVSLPCTHIRLPVLRRGLTAADAAQAKATGLKVVVILISLAVTVVGMWFINKKMDEVKHRVVYARRKRRCVAFFSFCARPRCGCSR